MVPLLGMQAGSVALPISARGATLDSSSALSVVTDRDFVSFEVCTPQRRQGCACHHTCGDMHNCTTSQGLPLVICKFVMFRAVMHTFLH